MEKNWVTIETDYGYDIIITYKGIGVMNYNGNGLVTRLIEMQTGNYPGYEYSLHNQILDPPGGNIMEYWFTEIIIMKYDKFGNKTNGGERRTAIPFVNLLRIK